MLIFLQFILLFTIINADSNPKYIDLLPEKEKQEFLENIARRILAEVQTKNDKPKESQEIPEEKLNEHDAFIQKIMKEESEKLKLETNDTEIETNKPNIGRILKNYGSETANYVDLTLRAEKNRTKRESGRKVFTGFSADNNNSTEQKSRESDVDIQVKNFRRSENNTEEPVIDQEVHEATSIDTKTNANTLEEVQEITTIDTNANTNNLDESKDYTQKSKREVIIPNNENNPQKTTKTDVFSITSLTETDSTSSVDEFHKTTINSENTQENIFTTHDDFHSSPTEDIVTDALRLEKIKETYENVFSDKTKISTKNNTNEEDVYNIQITESQNTTEEPLNMPKNDLIHLNLNQTLPKNLKDSDIINIEIAKIPASENATSENNYKESVDVTNSIINSTTEKVQVLTPKLDVADLKPTMSEHEETLKTKNKQRKNKSKLGKTKKKSNGTKKSNGIALPTTAKTFVNEVIKNLRIKLLESDNGIKTEEKTGQNEQVEIKAHDVFEVSPDEIPFVRQKTGATSSELEQHAAKEPKISRINIADKKQNTFQEPGIIRPKVQQHVMSEEAYQIPVYKHIPKNAFYNPKNVYGPNPDDTDDGEDDDVGFFGKDGNSFPSMMPKSAKKLKKNLKQKTVDQPQYVPVYYYSPKNAFYDPTNYYGPNVEDSSKSNDYDTRSKIHDHNIENYDEKNDEHQIEWQYYNDPHFSRVNDADRTAKNANKGEPIEIDLPKSVKDFILKNTNIHLEKYIKDNYINRINGARRCCVYKKQCSKCKFKPKSEENNAEDEEELLNPPLFDTMSQIRHMMLEAKYFMRYKSLNTSKMDAYFEEKPPVLTRNVLRSPLPTFYDDILYYRHRPQGNKQSDDNANFYDNTDSDSEKKIQRNKDSESKDSYVQDVHTKYYALNPLKLIYNYNKNNKIHPKPYKEIKTLEQILDIYKKPDKQTGKKYYKPRKHFTRSRTSPGELLKVANHLFNSSKPDKKAEFEIVKNMAEYLEDAEILELYLHLERMDRDSKRGSVRNTNNGELGAYEEVLGDMIQENNKALGKYDWLGTTVDIQSAIKKMGEMVASLQEEEDIHPSDMELLKYIIFLHSNARDQLQQSLGDARRGIIIANGKKRKRLIKESGHRIRAWDVRGQSEVIPKEELNELLEFLDDLQGGLYDLHNALKYIAIVTKYDHQHWFKSLKELYIDSTRKPLLEVLLHLCTTRLLGMMEESAKNGLEDDFWDYVKKNEKEFDRTSEEFVFVLKLLEEIKLMK